MRGSTGPVGPAVRASGVFGELRVGYQRAARVVAWSITPADRARAWVFRGRVDESNAYWLGQRPLDLMAEIGTAECVWRGVPARITADGEVEVELTGQPEVTERAHRSA